jgi:hypothetical protein
MVSVVCLLSIDDIFSRSLDILRQHFVPLVVEEQGVFNDPGNWNKVLKIVPDQGNLRMISVRFPIPVHPGLMLPISFTGQVE